MAPKRKRTTKPTAPRPLASMDATASVFGDDELLRKILLGLEFPTCLVRAAAVSKRWLRHASDPAFLRRFRDLHPPHLLGFYVKTESRGGSQQRLRFVPRPQLPGELAAVVRRGRFNLADDIKSLSDCRNGDLIFLRRNFFPYSPLRPERGTTALPQLPVPGAVARQMLRADAGDRTTVSFVRDYQRSLVLLSDAQAQPEAARATHLIELPQQWRICSVGLLAGGKLYMIGTVGYILGIDLASRSTFEIKLPRGVKFNADENFSLSRADGSAGFYLVHAKNFQIRVWHHRTGCSGTGKWKLVDEICVGQALGDLYDPYWCLMKDVIVYLCAVGDNADFVIFQIRHQVFHLHVKSRAVEMVFESEGSEYPFDVHPFMMVWPPTFPERNDGGHD